MTRMSIPVLEPVLSNWSDWLIRQVIRQVTTKSHWYLKDWCEVTTYDMVCCTTPQWSMSHVVTSHQSLEYQWDFVVTCLVTSVWSCWFQDRGGHSVCVSIFLMFFYLQYCRALSCPWHLTLANSLYVSYNQLAKISISLNTSPVLN